MNVHTQNILQQSAAYLQGAGDDSEGSTPGDGVHRQHWRRVPLVKWHKNTGLVSLIAPLRRAGGHTEQAPAPARNKHGRISDAKAALYDTFVANPGTPYRIKQLCTTTGIAHSAVCRRLKELCHEGLILRREVREFVNKGQLVEEYLLTTKTD